MDHQLPESGLPKSDSAIPDTSQRMAWLEARVAELEYGRNTPGMQLSPGLHPGFSAAFALMAIAFGYLSLGLPQHPYQPVFALLILLFLHHREYLFTADGPWKWFLLAANFTMLCLLMKFLIGGGIAHPFDWLRVPALSETPPDNDSWWGWLKPNVELQWQEVEGVSRWAIDLTRIQSLFLVVTLGAAVLRFQPFASLAALGLLVVSIPTLFRFNWEWVIWFLICTAVSIYLQRPGAVSLPAAAQLEGGDKSGQQGSG